MPRPIVFSRQRFSTKFKQEVQDPLQRKVTDDNNCANCTSICAHALHTGKYKHQTWSARCLLLSFFDSSNKESFSACSLHTGKYKLHLVRAVFAPLVYFTISSKFSVCMDFAYRPRKRLMWRLFALFLLFDSSNLCACLAHRQIQTSHLECRLFAPVLIR